jgi:hypothetical protein
MPGDLACMNNQVKRQRGGPRRSLGGSRLRRAAGAARATLGALAAMASVGAAAAAVSVPVAGQALGGACTARSAAAQTTLVELYTSEGCNACPPADRWLSGLTGRAGELAAAFHVDYWDRLGWADRFGSPRHTARQAEQQPFSGARFSYTPQVTVNGRDWRRWPELPLAAASALVRITAQRLDQQTVAVQVQALDGAPARLGLWWALLEDGHQSAVRAGENQGVTLRHDHVVRQYRREADWATPATTPTHWRLAAPARGEGGRAARLLLVVTDAQTRLPLQALALGC